MNLELNVTLKCNLSCNNCNRLCNIYRDRTEHMSVEQIEKFVKQIKNGSGIHRLKVLGGEPLLHPNFVEIYNILTKAAKDGAIRYIKIETNRTINIPKVENYDFVSWSGTIQRRKKHQPMLWSPLDLGFKNGPQPQCPQILKCGISLDKYGYLPCSLAIMISRLFGHTELYKQELPKEIWGLDKLCDNCVFSMPPQWRSKFSSKTIFEQSKEELTPTKSYKEAIENFNVSSFYETQKEF